MTNSRKKFVTKEILITLVLAYCYWGLLSWVIGMNNPGREFPKGFFMTSIVFLLIFSAYLCAIFFGNFLANNKALWEFMKKAIDVWKGKTVISFIIRNAIKVAVLAVFVRALGL